MSDRRACSDSLTWSDDWNRLFQCPFVSPVGMAMAMRREKSAAMPPEPRPDLFPVGLRQLQTVERRAGEKLEPAFGVVRRQRGQPRLHLKQEHQPVGLALITMLADEAGQVQVRRLDFDAEFLLRLAAGAGVGRFAGVHLQLAAARAPEAAVRLLRAFEQQHFIAPVEAIQQRGGFVGQNHGCKFQISDAECRMQNSVATGRGND